MTKIEKLKAAFEATPALLICDVDHMGPKTHKVVRLAELLMPQLLEAVEALRILTKACNDKPLDPLVMFASVEKARYVLEKFK